MNLLTRTASRLIGMMIACLLFGLMGCASQVRQDSSPTREAVEKQLNFVDIAKFDKDLAASLASDLAEVNVLFYAKVSPNQIPDRLQQWISVVENAGGKVRVEQPPNEPTPRAIPPLLSLLGTAYSAFKDQFKAQPELYRSAARGRQVVIALERSPTGDLLVEKIQFIK